MSDPCNLLTATATDGTLLTGAAHGGQVLGWVPAGGTDRLWLSPWSRCGTGLAMRGGVPVVFPQFSNRGELPKHGLVRDRTWSTTLGQGADGAAHFRAELRDDAATREVWPHAFALTLSASAAVSHLVIELEVANPGEKPFTFAAALHSYLTVGDPTGSTLSGLAGVPTEQNAEPGTTHPMPQEPLVTSEARDVAARGTGGPVTLHDPALGDLSLATTGFEDLVVWNPGRGHTLDDVPQGTEAGFVCVEPAQLTPVELAPGASWIGTVRFSL